MNKETVIRPFVPVRELDDLQKLIRAYGYKGSFFMYKGLPYDIIESYEDEGKTYIVGRNHDGDEVSQELHLPKGEWIGCVGNKQKIGAHKQSNI